MIDHLYSQLKTDEWGHGAEMLGQSKNEAQ